MKKHLYAIGAIVFILSSYSFILNRSIKGDKNVTTKEVKIDNYHAINAYGSADIIYEQKSDAAPYLTLEIDNNLREYVEIKIEGNSLNIRQKPNSSISPSKYIIRTNSKELREATIYGSGDITTVNKIRTEDKLFLTVKGSGNITVPLYESKSLGAYVFGSGDITVNGQSNSAELRVAGSGDITAKDIIVTSYITAQVDGSGDITLKGTSATVKYHVNGSGDIDGKALAAESANCSVVGSGDIIVNAKDKLENSISASGNIKYVGKPQIVNSIKGSGDVRAF